MTYKIAVSPKSSIFESLELPRYFSYEERLLKECMNMGKRKDVAYWNIPAPKVLDDALEEAVRRDTHSTKAGLVRDAVRRKLEEMGFRAQLFLEERKNGKSEP